MVVIMIKNMNRARRPLLAVQMIIWSFLFSTFSWAELDYIELDEYSSVDSSVEVDEEELYGRDKEILNGVVAPAVSFLQPAEAYETDSRIYGRIEFMRIPKNIGLDFRVGSGGGYTDLGLSIKFFKHWQFSTGAATGVSAGLGIGGLYSKGSDAISSELDFNPGENGENDFIELFGAPFIRYIWDWGNQFGMGVELEYQILPFRRFVQSPTKTIEDVQQKFALTVMFLFGV